MRPDEEPRLRPRPSERFAAAEHRLDLRAAADALRAEPHPARAGHRQQALYRRGPVTIALFAFEEGAELTDHAASGLVTIHALAGELAVRTDNEIHALPAGTMLVLAPGVRHSVRAARPSEMLLSVHRETPGEGTSPRSGA
jgi:quercetin dioxygenase-like cupin family protein